MTTTSDAIPPLAAPPCSGIFCGDNIDTMREWPASCIDLVVTSPPYDDLRAYGGHSWNLEGVAGELVRIIKLGGVIVWVVQDKIVDGSRTLSSMRHALHFQSLGLKIWDVMIWEKTMCRYGDTSKRYAGAWEYMFVFSKGSPKTINLIRDVPNKTAGSIRSLQFDRRPGRKRTGRKPHVTAEFGYRKAIWKIHVGGGGQHKTVESTHPAMFPEALARDHILSWSNPGDVVLDPFAGSGTTLKAAKELGRQHVGIEIAPEYVEVCKRRIAQDVLPMSFPNDQGHL